MKKQTQNRAQEAAHRRADRTGRPVPVKNAKGKTVQIIQPARQNPSGKFVKAKAVRVRRVGRRFVVDIKR